MDQARPRATKPGEQVTVGVAAISANAVARLQAKREQAPRDPICREIKLGVGPTTIGERQGCLVAETICRTPQGIAYGVPDGACHPSFNHGLVSLMHRFRALS